MTEAQIRSNPWTCRPTPTKVTEAVPVHLSQTNHWQPSMNTLNIREIGLAQRLMLWGILLWPIGFLPPAFLFTIPFQLYCVYRLARALALSTLETLIALALIFAPLICLASMLWINFRAVTALRSSGIPTGWLGVRLKDLPPH